MEHRCRLPRFVAISRRAADEVAATPGRRSRSKALSRGRENLRTNGESTRGDIGKTPVIQKGHLLRMANLVMSATATTRALDEAALVRAVIDRDPQAWRELVRRFQAPLRDVVRDLVEKHAFVAVEIEDLLGDGWLCSSTTTCTRSVSTRECDARQQGAESGAREGRRAGEVPSGGAAGPPWGDQRGGEGRSRNDGRSVSSKPPSILLVSTETRACRCPPLRPTTPRYCRPVLAKTQAAMTS